jgi:hypothetical protein
VVDIVAYVTGSNIVVVGTESWLVKVAFMKPRAIVVGHPQNMNDMIGGVA